MRRKQVPDGKIEKPEDKEWKKWYETLGVEEHEQYLGKLGLDREDIEEWEEAEGLKKSKSKKK